MSEQANSTLMQDLLDGSQTDQAEEKEEKVETAEVETDQSKVATVTAEFAEEAGLPKWMIGKPMKEVSKAIRNLNAGFTQKSQALSELGKKVEQLEKTIMSQVTTKAEKKEAQDVIDDIPDPVLDHNAFNRWLEQRDKRKETEIEKKIGDMFESKFGSQLKTVEEYTNKQREIQIMTTIADSVGEDVDINELILEWGTEYGVVGNDDEIKSWFARPQQMAKSVIAFHKAKRFEELSRKDAKEKGDEAVKKVKQAIRETEKKKPTDLNSVKREDKKDRSPLMGDLLEMVED